MNILKIGFPILVFTCLTGLCACSDSNDEGNASTPSDSGLTFAQAEQRTALVAVLNHLTNQKFSETGDVNFEGHVYEPVIGMVRDENKPSERCIRLESAEMAEGYFRSLADGASSVIKETADGCIIDLGTISCHSQGKEQHFGTLTFHRQGTTDNVGYADVDIACIPGLQRISYKTSSQWGENYDFRSPISEGEVFFGEGLYWLCVKEAQGENRQLCGILMNVQSGKSQSWKPYISSCDASDDDYWGAWGPKDNILPMDYNWAILNYVRLSGSSDFNGRKRKILKQSFGRQVFPTGYVWYYDQGSGLWVLGNNEAEGFACVDGYCHKGRFNGQERGVIIVRDATEGPFRGIGFGWWRQWRMYCTSVTGEMNEARMRSGNTNINNLDMLMAYVFSYTNRDDFFKFAEHSVIYTVRAKIFNTDIPYGFSKVM